VTHDTTALTVAIALASGVAFQCAARTLRVPAIILLLAAGVALGPEGAGWVRPASLGGGLFILIDFAVAIILFEGAMNLEIGRLRREERAIRRLVTVGALITFVGGAAAARLWFDWEWRLALLFGSLVIVTGPTVVGPLVRDLRLQPRLQTVLEAEGVLIDPIGALVAVVALQLALASEHVGPFAVGGDLLARLLAGTGVGVAGGLVIAGALRIPALVHGLENVLTLATVILLFHLSEHWMTPTGLLAVTVAGLVVGNLKSPVDEDLREFKDQLTVLMIGAVFILLAADISLADVWALGAPGIGVLATLVLIVRPLGVLAATRGATLTRREVAFVASFAPRGIVAAAVASLVAASLTDAGVAGGAPLKALVFLVIAGTDIAAGLVAWPLSAALGLRLPARDRVAIVGAQGLALALGRELAAAGQTVVFIDADPRRCQQAEAEGFSVVFGDALLDRTLRRVPIHLVGTAIGATFNDNLNSQFVRLARESFGVPNGLVWVDTLAGARVPEHVARHRADLLFEGVHDQERWDVRWRQGEVEIVRGEYVGEPVVPEGEEPPADARAKRQEAAVILTIEHGNRVLPMSFGRTPRKGDRGAVAIVRTQREEARAALARLGWQLLDEPAVETEAAAATTVESSRPAGPGA
jgi:NhaP-type Na+/H+ or K+/H+ antiporter